MHPLPNKTKNPSQVHKEPTAVFAFIPAPIQPLGLRSSLHTGMNRECWLPKNIPFLVWRNILFSSQASYQSLTTLWAASAPEWWPMEKQRGRQISNWENCGKNNRKLHHLTSMRQRRRVPWNQCKNCPSNWASKDKTIFLCCCCYFLWCSTIVVHYCHHHCWQLIQSTFQPFLNVLLILEL